MMATSHEVLEGVNILLLCLQTIRVKNWDGKFAIIFRVVFVWIWPNSYYYWQDSGGAIFVLE